MLFTVIVNKGVGGQKNIVFPFLSWSINTKTLRFEKGIPDDSLPSNKRSREAQKGGGGESD